MAIFRKLDEDNGRAHVALPVIRQTVPSRHRNTSVIAATWLSGDNLLSAEGLMINGNLECTMAHHNKNLTVGKRACVTADLSADKVTVFGQLVGNIRNAGVVLLAKGSIVSGNISCACLYIEEGAQFRGQIEMDESGTRPEDCRVSGAGR